MERGSVTPLVLPGSALSGDSLWAWSASCFTILGTNVPVCIGVFFNPLAHIH